MYNCEYCKTVFKSISSLNLHKKSAKYCLNIQNKNVEDFICEYCGNNFTSKQNVNKHILTCKDKNVNITFELNELIKNLEDEIKNLNNKIIEKDSYISRLEAENNIYKKDHDILTDIAKNAKVKTINNNTINNLAVYDIDKITEQFTNKLEYMTKEDIINGQRGIANIIAPCLRDENGNKMLTCTDTSRLVFAKLDSNKNRTKDIELKDLASVIKPIAIKKADEILDDYNKIREKAFRVEFLKDKIKDYNKYIEHFTNIIETSCYNERYKKECEKKIEEYEKNICLYNIEIEQYNNDEIYGITDEKEEENDKILDGHTDIKQLDKESIKFARQVSKLL
jgi:prefoldin subunit 5